MSWLRPLGNTGLEVSALGLGTVKFGRNQALKYPDYFELPTRAEAARLLDHARDLGINLLDTAPAYGDAEERLGSLLRGQRNDWLLCTKVGEEFDGSHPHSHRHPRSHYDFTPEHCQRSVRRSLTRLQTETLDIVLVHSNGDDLEIITRYGTLEALQDLKAQGLIRAFGMSTKSVEGGLAAAPVCDVVMATYNAWQQSEAVVLHACAQNNTGVLVKKMLASGHLGSADEAPKLPATSTEIEAAIKASVELVIAHCGTSCGVVGTLSAGHLEQVVGLARRALTLRD